MSVHFECRTVLAGSASDAFDRSRSVDEHLGSMAASGRTVRGANSTATVNISRI
ncbi:hypothetical protein ACLRGF_05075 [Mycetocola zhadangensis]|uniref:hypothetical protein n=1 Tax=Mycetocola zhadangensis TaxID=1164595 RepID=UPI003A4E07A0